MNKDYSKEEILDIVGTVMNAINCCAKGDLQNFTKEEVMDNIFNITASTTPENSHNDWVQKKLKEGWTYGHINESAKKITPNLVAYKQLPQINRIKDYVSIALVRKLWLKLD